MNKSLKIAIDISPLSSGHSVRGVGFYLRHLRDALEKYYPEHTYVLFKDRRDVPSSVDLIHYPYFDPFTLSYPLVKTKPTVVTVHDLTPLKFPQHFPVGIKGRLKWQLNKGILRTMDGIITDSDCSRTDIVDIVDYPESKIHVVHLAAAEGFRMLDSGSLKKDTLKSKIQDLRSKYNLPEKFALYVGDVTWNKNLPRLVEAALETDIPLVMVGKALAEQDYDREHPWNKDRVTVQKMIEGKSTVLPLGFVEDEDLVALYNAATLFVFPSLYEGFGLPILEAMACGTPVVTSKGGSLEEVAGEAAYYIDPERVESIAHGMEKIWKYEKMQKEFSQKGLERAKEFSWKRTASQTLMVYEKVLSRAINNKS